MASCSALVGNGAAVKTRRCHRFILVWDTRYPSGYPPPGYGPGERWRVEQVFREHCERLENAEHEIRDRLAYTPYGEERERLQYRLGEIHQERERCWRR